MTIRTDEKRKFTLKQYFVSVEVLFDTEGNMHPVRVHWLDGRVFEIDHVVAKSLAFAKRGQRSDVKYTVQIGNEVTSIYYAAPRWYVMAQESQVPWAE